MKRISKKFMSLFLILALLVTTLLPGAGVVAAEEPEVKETSYMVKIEPVEHGKIKSEKETYQPGETVLLEVQPDEQYQLAELTVINQDKKELPMEEENDGYQFEMPEGNVQISATMEPKPEQETQQSEVGETSTRQETEHKETETKEKEPETVEETEKSTETKQAKAAKIEITKETEQLETEEAVKRTARATTHNFPQIQKSGQAIFKCDQVTKITSSTVMPSDYTFYMRGRANSGAIGFKDGQAADPQPDSQGSNYSRYAALREKYKKGGAEEGKVYCLYENVGIYNGQWVDVKLTATDWETKHSSQNPWNYAVLCFNTTRPGIYVIWAKWVEIKYEFFVHGTQTAINVKGYSTWQDVDAGQGVALKGAFESFYATPACELKYATVGGNPYFYSPDEENIGTDKEGTRKFTALFSGKQATVIYSFQKPSDDATDDDANPYMTCSGGISNQSKKDVPGPVPTIQKRVSDNDEKLVTEDTLNQSPEPRKETFTYTITSTVYPEDTNTFYNLYQIRDEIDNGLIINQGAITITNEEGSNVKSSFDIAVDANNVLTITAKAAKLQNVDFYGHIYTFNIPVNIKGTTVLNKAPYWQEANNRAKISNQATLRTSLGDLQSNIVNTYVPLYGSVEEGLTITKTEDGTGIPLSGVTFQVYEWNGNAYSTTVYDTLEESFKVGTYTNTKPYLITNTNQGKFKVVETQSAIDHFNSGWSQEIQYDGTEAKELTYSVSNVKMNPKIAVTKLADRTTLEGDKKTPGWYKYGEKITFAVVAKNTGDVPVKNMVVTDTMSEELRKAVDVESAAFVVPETATTTKGGQVHITKNSATQVTLDALEPEDSVLLTFVVNVGSREQVKGLTNLINLENVVKVTATYYNGQQDATVPEDADDTDQDQVNVYNPLISVTKLAGRTTVEADGGKISGWYDYENVITYTMKVKNYGNVPVNNLIVLDTLSEELANAVEEQEAAFVVEQEDATTEKGNPVQIKQDPENGKRITLDTLEPGDSVTLTFTAKVKPRADLKDFPAEKLEQLDNQVRVTGEFDVYDSEPEQVPPDEDDQDQDQVNIYNPLVSITKQADKTTVEEKEDGEGGKETVKTSGWYHYGDTILYTMVASNNGNVPVLNLVVEDTLSEELTAAIYADEAEFVLEAVDPETPGGTDGTEETEVPKTQGQTAAAEGTEDQEETQKPEGSEETEEEEPEEPEDSVLTVTYITKNGNQVQVTKDPENGKKLTLDALAPGDSVTLTFQAKVRPREDLKDFDLAKLEKLNNQVKITGEYDNGGEEPAKVTEDEDDQANDDINIYQPLLSVTKQADKTTVTGEGARMPGQYDFEETITYAILVRNYGNVAATELLLEDTLSEELQKTVDMQSASFVEGTLTTENGKKVKAVKESNTKLLLDRLEAGDSVTVTFQAKVKSREDLKDYDAVQLEKLNNHVAVTGKYDGDKIITKDEDDEDDETIDIRNPKLSVIKVADKTTGIKVNDGTYTGEKKPGVYNFGDKVTYSITVKNTGNVEIFAIQVKDAMSKKLRKMAESGRFEVKDHVETSLGNTVAVTGNGQELVEIEKLLPGESVTLKFVVVLEQNGIKDFEDIKNVVLVSGSYDPDDPKDVPKDEDDQDEDLFDLAYGHLEIEKVSEKEKKALAGAEFEIYRKNGTLVQTIKTNRKGIATSQELGIGSYYLVEVKAPVGYKLRQEKITFEIKKDKEVVKKQITNEADGVVSDSGSVSNTNQTAVSKGNPPKTGDSTDYMFYVGILVIAAAAFILGIKKRKK